MNQRHHIFDKIVQFALKRFRIFPNLFNSQRKLHLLSMSELVQQ